MSNPVITVVMSVYNAAPTVGLALRSILNQTFENWELIIIDDGSTDRTREIVSHIRDPRIRFILEPSGNLGLAPRLNQCVRMARGQYIARMDADDVAYPQRLERQVRFLHAHPNIDLLGTGALLFKGEGSVFGLYPMACEHDDICRRPWWGFRLAHPTWMGNRKWFSSHPYREGRVRCEDQDLLLQTYMGSRFAALGEVLLGYRIEKPSISNSLKGRYHYCQTLASGIRDVGSTAMAVRGICTHALGFGRDLLEKLVGVNTQMFQRRRTPIDVKILERWNNIWCVLNEESMGL